MGVNAAASREQFVYRVDALRARAEESVELLADTVLNPSFLDSEIEEAKRVAEFQHMDISMNPHVVIQEVRTHHHRSALGARRQLTAHHCGDCCSRHCMLLPLAPLRRWVTP